MAHDGSEGLSPDGWLPDRISVGVLARVFTPELVDAAVDAAGAREQRAAGVPPDKISFPHALAAATDTIAAFSP